MDLSPLNKNFLEVLHKLSLDTENKDKTFDGLFDNVPEDFDYFFNWFIENITPENSLTRSEGGAYLALISAFPPSREEVEYTLSTHKPTYEELRSIDPNYINILLRRDLIDLQTNKGRLNEIIEELDSLDYYLKSKYTKMKEESNSLKKELVSAREDCNKANVLFSKKLEQAEEVLLKEPELNINFDVYKECLQKESNVFDQIEDLKIFSDMYEPSELISSELIDDFVSVEMSSILTQGFLIGKKKKIEALSKLLHKKSLQESLNESLMQSQLTNYEDVNKITNDIKELELKLLEKHHKIGQNKMDEIIEQYFQDKTGLCETYMTQLNIYKNSLACNNQFNEALVEILNKTMSNLEKELSLRKNVYSKIKEHERDLTDSISNLELQSKRFKEVSTTQVSPLLQAVKDVINIDKDFGESEETFNNLMNLLSSISGDTKFDVENLKKKLDSSIIEFFSEFLCGPTSEVLFTPVDALADFQQYENKEKGLLSYVKKIASNYLEAKNSTAVNDRKSLLLWIKFLTNVSASKNN